MAEVGGLQASAAGGSGTNPGDEAEPGTPGTGENVCPACSGTGRLKEAACPDCGGTGVIVEGIGGG
jgi:DnaJ-class molecular chaperone